ncbi:MAG: radical SAM protein [Bacteroidales bacterium]|nr:radical SAM protein [Bacteroidales bacterium]
MKAIEQYCYRLPWTADDNPNGWIEPTTFCQLKCPGCYRGVDKEGHKSEHFLLEELKKQVDAHIRERNIQTLSIAGGEPLLYPELPELISYATEKGLRTMIYTNGIGLDEQLLGKLKQAGATQILVHVDRFQGRKGVNSITDVIREHRKYCELFRKTGGVNLGFIQPVTKACLAELPLLTGFFSQNRDIISLVVFTLYREICWDHKKKPTIDTSITIDELISHLTGHKVFRAASYLPSTHTPGEPAWVFSYAIGTGNRILGFLDKRVYRSIQKNYYRYKARHLFISKNYQVKPGGLHKYFYFPSIFRILVKRLSHPAKDLFFQTYLVIRGPLKKGDHWDLCDGCPDAMYYKGKLEPSCLLEEIQRRN